MISKNQKGRQMSSESKLQKEIRIKFDFGHGPIWKDVYDIQTGEWSTGIDIIDYDHALNVLNDAAQNEYTSLYSFDTGGRPVFDEKAYADRKESLNSLVRTIILRLNDINDGSFVVVNETDDMFVPEVIKVTPLDSYVVEVLFQDGKTVSYDVSHLLDKGAFSALKDTEFYRSRCTVMNHTLAWDLTGECDPARCLDIDPYIIYYGEK